MTKLDQVRALFVPGEQVECVDNTYHRSGGRMDYIGRVWVVGTVGKTVWSPDGDENFRGTFPTRASDVLSVDADSATWRIGREDHTVTYRRVRTSPINHGHCMCSAVDVDSGQRGFRPCPPSLCERSNHFHEVLSTSAG